MGLTASIVQQAGKNFSNGGTSAFVTRVCIVNIENGGSEPRFDCPPVMLVQGAYPGIAIVVDAEEIPGDNLPVEYLPVRDTVRVGPMMGGAFVTAPDSRFCDAVEKITGGRFYGAVPFHDRFETVEHYASFD